MHLSGVNHLLLLALAARRIAASPTQFNERGLEVSNITPPPVDPDNYDDGSDDTTDTDDKRDLSSSNVFKRGLQVTNITPPPVDPDSYDDGSDGSDDSNDKRDLLPRGYDIDSCGSHGGQWMPLVAVKSGEYGFNDAASSFCNHFDGTVIPGDASVAALVQSTGGEILRLTSGEIGHFQGTISCKKGHTCTVAAQTCTEYVLAITSKGGKCYGKKNKDTKGGRNKLSDSYYSGLPLKGAQS